MIDNKQLVSIIVPIYNAEKYLKECLESILNQTYKNIEIFLINDGSVDKSKEICEYYSKKYSNIKLINKKNEGVSKARNIGIKEAKGKYIFFCDSDDIMFPKQIEKLVTNLIATDSELSICSFINFFDNYIEIEKNNKNFKLEKILDKDKMIETIIFKKEYSGYLWNKLFKLDIIKSKKQILFDEKINIVEDQLFVLEYIANIKSLCVTNEELYGYRQNLQSVLHQKFSEKKITAIFAREKRYNLCKAMTSNEKINKNNWNFLLQTYLYFYKKLFVNKIENKKYWQELIERKIQKYKNEYSNLNIKEIKYRGYLYLLIIYFYLKNNILNRRNN